MSFRMLMGARRQAYDYAGSWLNFTDNQDNVYGGARTGFSTDQAVKFYLGNGATPSKVIMGMPLYGRAFEDTLGLGQAYNGIGPGTTEAGIYLYKDLPSKQRPFPSPDLCAHTPRSGWSDGL